MYTCIYIYIYIYIYVFLPERQTGRCSLPTDKFHHAAGPATFAGAQGADPLGRCTGFLYLIWCPDGQPMLLYFASGWFAYAPLFCLRSLRLANLGGRTSVPAPWSNEYEII